MANYSKIKRVKPLQSHLAMTVEGNWKSAKWEYIEEVKRRTGKLRREVVVRLDEGSARGSKTAQDRRLCPITIKRLEVQPLCKDKFWGVGLEEWGAVSQCLGRGAISSLRPYYVWELRGFLCLTFFVVSLLCNHNKYTLGHRREKQASYPHHHPSLLL